MVEFGIVDSSGIRLRPTTDEEKNEIEQLYKHNNEKKNAKESSIPRD